MCSSLQIMQRRDCLYWPTTSSEILSGCWETSHKTSPSPFQVRKNKDLECRSWYSISSPAALKLLSTTWWFYNVTCFCCADSPETWSEVNTLRLAYSTPKVLTNLCAVRPAGRLHLLVCLFTLVLCRQEGQAKHFLFALSSRRNAYSHFYCRSSDLVSLAFTSLLPQTRAAPGKSHIFVVYRRWVAGCMAACRRTVPHGESLILSPRCLNPQPVPISFLFLYFPWFQCQCSGSLPWYWASATIQGKESSAGSPGWVWAAVVSYLPPAAPQILILTLSDLSAVSHLVVSASNLNGKQVIKNRKTHFLQPASFWGQFILN